ncbi:hypothetical protein GTZ97_07170 [Aquabacterium fontiphilum]|uniref:tetratricopeptide repeat protein n=1 Tax=Aquabacterium fontiphilum TaxID=450365 RepID=UPI00137847CA|nr:tetratricopeptide repeat protein [Aquabacterium fontiphilum]NBD20453.1 hypothetical protein [Aquabacterium fontiphilum]
MQHMQGALERPFFVRALIPLGALLLIAVLLLAYSDVRLNGYAWDDWEIVNRAAGMPGQGVVDIVLSPLLPGAPYFRPLAMATFVAEMRVTEPRPAVSHWISVSIHATNVVVLYSILIVLARRLGSRINVLSVGWCIAATALYALHPALIESVAWASARFDLLATLLSLLYIWVGLVVAGLVRIPLMFFIFLAALMCKEVVVGVPLFFALMQFWLKGDGGGTFNAFVRQMREGILICLVGVGLYFYAKGYLIDRAVFTDQFVSSHWSGWKRLSLVGETIVQYLMLVFLPFSSIGPHHPIPWENLSGPRPFVMAVGVAAVFVSLLAFVVRGHGLLIAGFVLIMLPVLNVLPLSVAGSIAADRYLTLPLAALVILSMCYAGRRLTNMKYLPRPWWLLVPVGVSFVCIMNVMVTVPLWKNDLTLWAWAAEKHLDQPYVRKNHVSSLIAYGMPDKAEAVLAKPMTLPVDRPDIRLQEGLLKAQMHLKRGEWLQSLDALDGVETLTEVFWRKATAAGDDPADMWLPSDSPVANSDEIRVFLTRTEALLALRRFEEAKVEAQKALFINRRSHTARALKSFALYGLRDVENAEREYKLALESMLPQQREVAELAKQNLLKRLDN